MDKNIVGVVLTTKLFPCIDATIFVVYWPQTDYAINIRLSVIFIILAVELVAI